MTLPLLSLAVTVKVAAVPAVMDVGKPLTTNMVATAPPLTTMPFWLPVRDALTVSWAVSDHVPGVLKVALKVPVPPLSVELAGSVAARSVLLKWIVPVYPVATLPQLSLAVTLKLPATPTAVGDGKPATITTLAGPGLTTMPFWLPVTEAFIVSVAVSDQVPAVLKVALKVPVPLLVIIPSENAVIRAATPAPNPATIMPYCPCGIKLFVN